MELIKSREGFAPFGSYQTWYRITGDLEGGRTPLVILHGGPGCTYDYVDAYKDVAAGGYPVIHYDQLGNGRSTHLPDMPPSFWTVSLFLEELDNLLEHLGISERYALLGQSWGGMLGSVHAARRPAGLRCLVIANSPVDMGVWMEEANRLRQELPEEIQATLLKHEATGDYMAADYLAATRFFYNKHVCRLNPWPDEVERTFAQVDADPTVYHAMTGPNEFTITGSTKDWSIEDCLPQINVPSLLISGRYDEATPRVIQPFLDLVPGIQSAIFENSSHMPHVEERVACMGTVVNFLDHSL